MVEGETTQFMGEMTRVRTGLGRNHPDSVDPTRWLGIKL